MRRGNNAQWKYTLHVAWEGGPHWGLLWNKSKRELENHDKEWLLMEDSLSFAFASKMLGGVK
jgi:hypothetical protein